MSIQSLMSASLTLSRMKTVQSANTQVQGQINVLKSEIKTDGGDANKEKKVDELEERSGNMMNDLMGQLNDTNEELKSAQDMQDTGETQSASHSGAPSAGASSAQESSEGSSRGATTGSFDTAEFSGMNSSAVSSGGKVKSGGIQGGGEPATYDVSGKHVKQPADHQGKNVDAKA